MHRAPSYYLQVPATQLPEAILNSVPLGNMCIISHLDVCDWLWFRFEQQRQLLFAGMSRLPGKPEIIPAFRHLLAPILKHSTLVPDKRPQHQQQQQRTTLEEVDPNAGYSVDIEDLWRSFPPCMEQLKNNAQFPRHLERLRSVQILQTAGVSYQVVENWLVSMDNKYPKGSQGSTKSRFDYERAWKSNLGPFYCANIMRDTILNKPNTLRCPHVPVGFRGDADRNLKTVWMSQCAGGGNVNFSGPHHLIKRRLGVTMVTEQKEEAEEDKQPMFEKEEDSEERLF